MHATAPLRLHDTEYSADSIEWCPLEGYRDLFVCGTYQVVQPDPPAAAKRADEVEGDEEAGGVAEESGSTRSDGFDDEDEEEGFPPKPTQRTGRLLLFQANGTSGDFDEVQRIDTAAILDAKWAPRLDGAGRPVLAVADAKGAITFYRIDPETRRLKKQQRLEVADDTILCLSIEFSPHTTSGAPELIVSLSNGELALLTPEDGSEALEVSYEVVQSWKAHDYEPWITSFDRWTPRRVWSGGDDCVMKCWDLDDTSRPVFVTRNFDAGVTTITSSPHTPHLLAVGSYDANLRIFDARAPFKPIVTIPCAGGIWRTRFHPSPDRAGDILLACMQGGFTTVRLDERLVCPATSPDDLDWSALKFDAEGGEERSGRGDEGEEVYEGQGWKVLARMTDSSVLAYGADWSRLAPGEDGSLATTCSFYDHTMHVWRA